MDKCWINCFRLFESRNSNIFITWRYFGNLRYKRLYQSTLIYEYPLQTSCCRIFSMSNLLNSSNPSFVRGFMLSNVDCESIRTVGINNVPHMNDNAKEY